MLIPLVTLGAVQYRTADRQVETTGRIEAQAAELATLIQLSGAVMDEAIASTLVELLPELGFSPDSLALLGIDPEATVTLWTTEVDGILDQLDAPDVEAAVGDARALIQTSGVTTGQLTAAFDDVDRLVSDRVNAKIAELERLSAAAGAERVGEAAQVVEAATQASTAARRLIGRYAAIQPGERVVVPMGWLEAVDDIRVRYDLWVEQLEGEIADDPELDQRWQLLRDDPGHRQLFDIYDQISNSYRVDGVDPGVETLEFNFADVTALDLLDLGVSLGRLLSLDTDLRADLDEFATLAFGQLEQEAVAAADAARSQRLQVIWLAAIVGLWIVTLAAGVIAYVARPIRQFGLRVEALRAGDLQSAISERGPAEINLAARALNEALASLRVAEAQAMALAEERLDDPVLELQAPGRLGASLQAEVSRLASSLHDREEFRRRLDHQASRDPLTALANRLAVVERLDSALARTRRASSSVALLVIDIDRFRSLNDAVGQLAGDAVLRTVGQRLTRSTRDGDLAGRLGGDQFVVVAEAVEGLDEALGLADRIRRSMEETITYNGQQLRVGVSIGVAISDDGLTADELLRDADLAVFRGKELGGGRVDVCDEDARARMNQQISTEQAIRQAVANGEFSLWFQPSIRATDGQIHSVEALIRWYRPEHGLVPPDDFIPVAERSGLIIEIDLWVLDEAARHLAAWRAHPVLGQISVAVNISARHLGGGNLCRAVQDVLERHQVEPDRLVIEVTETAALEDLDGTATELRRLRQLGVRAALDDFGTGYMSLAHLRELPFDVLKIDRSFVDELGSDTEHSLVRLISEAGRVMGATITAEGVETETQAEILGELGSDHLQGFLFSPPLDRPALEAALEREPWSPLFPPAAAGSWASPAPS